MPPSSPENNDPDIRVAWRLSVELVSRITLQPLSGARTLWLLLRGALGRLDGAEGVDSFAFDELVVRPRKGARRAKVAMDGEVLRMPPPLVFRTAPRPLRLLVPSAAPAHGDGPS